MGYQNLTQALNANRVRGYACFCPENLKAFRTAFVTPLMDGHYFVTCEELPTGGPRKFTVRYACNNGDIDVLGGFMQWTTLASAMRYLREEFDVCPQAEAA